MTAAGQSVRIDFAQFNKSDLQETERYLLRTLGTCVIPDAKDPDALEYMQFALLLDAHLLAAKGERDIYVFWKKVYKAVRKSESRFQYHVYKGHILIRIALSSLTADGNLDLFLDTLRAAYAEDKAYYNNPDLRSAYKIMSFMQPIAMFRNELWPIAKEVRRRVANRLVIVLSLNRSKWGIALHPDTLARTIAACIPNNPDLLAVLTENIHEMFSDAEAAENKHMFAKSVMFLLGGIVEAVLLDLATRVSIEGEKMHVSPGSAGRSREEIEARLSRASIKQLAGMLRKSGVIKDETEYCCRFVQHYRDFVHPPRNVKHKYKLDHNFHKMFILFSVLLLEDLSKPADACTRVTTGP
jgi:hypothetical protein